MHDPACQEALLAAQHLIARVFYFHDTRDFTAEAACFAEDGAWLRKGELLEGRARIVATLEARPRSLVTMHVVTNVVVERFTADSADVAFFLTTHLHDDGTPVTGPVGLRRPPSVGIGRATLVKRDSAWLIHRFATEDWVFLSRLAP